MTNSDLDMVEKMALHLANMTALEESHQVQDMSCKITFILSLLVRPFKFIMCMASSKYFLKCQF